jgi:hypothetical protein
LVLRVPAWLPSLDDAVAKMVAVMDLYDPNPENRAVCNAAYATCPALYPDLVNLFGRTCAKRDPYRPSARC